MKISLSAVDLVLVWCFVFGNASAYGQAPVGSSTTGQHSSAESATPGNAISDDGARLMQLLHNRPEVAGLLKGYLAQRLRIEGVDIDEKSITNQMLYERIQTDPLFAKDAS